MHLLGLAFILHPNVPGISLHRVTRQETVDVPATTCAVHYMKGIRCSVLNATFILTTAGRQLRVAVWAEKAKVFNAVMPAISVDMIEDER